MKMNSNFKNHKICQKHLNIVQIKKILLENFNV